MKTFLRSASVLVIASAALAASAQATAYSSFSSSGAYNANAGYSVGPNGGVDRMPGIQFTSGESGTIASFTLAMNNLNAVGPQGYSLGLYADDGSNRLGVLLGTYPGTSTGVTGFGSDYPVSTVPATTPALVVAGAKYWLVASSASSLAWRYSSVAGVGPTYAGSAGTYGTGVPTAFSVSVNPTPEPSALAALGLGAVGLLRRRKRA